jgi:hypothetical protein
VNDQEPLNEREREFLSCSRRTGDSGRNTVLGLARSLFDTGRR